MKTPSLPSRRLLPTAMLLMTLTPGFIHLATAANGTWSGAGGNGSWTNSSNWVGAIIPGQTSPVATNPDTATFNNNGTANIPVVIDSTRNLQNITFDTGSVGSFTLGTTGGNALQLSNNGVIQMTSTVTTSQAFNAPINFRGTAFTSSLRNDSTTSSAVLTAGGNFTTGSGNTGTVTLTGTNTGENTVSGALLAPGGLGNIGVSKTGSGTWVLSGTNTYNGATSVTAGTLLINGSNTSANGSVTVSNIGTLLGGAGIIGGSTTLNANTKLSAGSSSGVAGTLTFTNGLNLSASSNNSGAYLFDLDNVGSSDRILLTGGTLNVGTLDASDFLFATQGGFSNGTYILFDSASPITGSIGSAVYDFGLGVTGTLSISGVTNDVLLTVVPEPSTFLFLLGSVIALAIFRSKDFLRQQRAS
jgi:autotransporter-associated beta strand protein